MYALFDHSRSPAISATCNASTSVKCVGTQNAFFWRCAVITLFTPSIGSLVAKNKIALNNMLTLTCWREIKFEKFDKSSTAQSKPSNFLGFNVESFKLVGLVPVYFANKQSPHADIVRHTKQRHCFHAQC